VLKNTRFENVFLFFLFFENQASRSRGGEIGLVWCLGRNCCSESELWQEELFCVAIIRPHRDFLAIGFLPHVRDVLKLHVEPRNAIQGARPDAFLTKIPRVNLDEFVFSMTRVCPLAFLTSFDSCEVRIGHNYPCPILATPPHSHCPSSITILNPNASCIISQNQACIMHQFLMTACILHHESQPTPAFGCGFGSKSLLRISIDPFTMVPSGIQVGSLARVKLDF
jgi:hypothetical protein